MNAGLDFAQKALKDHGGIESVLAEHYERELGIVPDLLIGKYGGFSVADIQSTELVLAFMLAEQRRRIHVTSAPGRTPQDQTKVTDYLLQIAEQARNGTFRENLFKHVKSRYQTIASHFGVSSDVLQPHFENLEAFIRDKTFIPENIYRDHVAVSGERLEAPLLAACYNAILGKDIAHVADPKDIPIITNGVFGGATVLQETFENIKRYFKQGLAETDNVFIVPGFHGIHGDHFTAFTRGGSDLTAVYMAYALRNTFQDIVIEKWTETAGVLRAPPKIVQDPEIIRQMTPWEIREIAYYTELIHPDTFGYLASGDVSMVVRSTTSTSAPMTYVSNTQEPTENIIKAIAPKDGFSVYSMDHQDDPHTTLKYVVDICNRSNVPIDHVNLTGSKISIAANADAAAQIAELTQLGSVEIKYKRLMVTLVGEGMRELQADLVPTDQYSTLAIQKTGMNDEVGYISKLINIAEEGSCEITQMTTGIDALYISVNTVNRTTLAVLKENLLNQGMVSSSENITIQYNEMLPENGQAGVRSLTGKLGEAVRELSEHGMHIENIFSGSQRSTTFQVGGDINAVIPIIYDVIFR